MAVTNDPYRKDTLELATQAQTGAGTAAAPVQQTNTQMPVQPFKPFHYSINGDALYQQYKDMYQTQGRQAMRNTMAQASSLTGGYGNSYGMAAGQQQYNAYLQKLGDIVPQLEQNAYGRFKDYQDQALAQVQVYLNYGQQPPADLVAASGLSPDYIAFMLSNRGGGDWYGGGAGGSGGKTGADTSGIDWENLYFLVRGDGSNPARVQDSAQILSGAMQAGYVQNGDLANWLRGHRVDREDV